MFLERNTTRNEWVQSALFEGETDSSGIHRFVVVFLNCIFDNPNHIPTVNFEALPRRVVLSLPELPVLLANCELDWPIEHHIIGWGSRDLGRKRHQWFRASSGDSGRWNEW